MKILITGSTGFIGSHLCHRLASEGHQVTAFHRSTSDITLLKDLNLQHAIGDITDFESLQRAAQGSEIVIHAAAYIFYWRKYREIQNKINLEGTRNVVRACRQSGARRLVHVSSVAAIGISSDSPANEDFVFNLDNTQLNYHLSKRRAEQEVTRGVAQGLDAVIVNPSTVMGAFGKQYRGGGMIERVRRQRLVTDFRGGINVVHVDDVVDGIVRALARGKRGERYILGGENLSYRRINEIIAECFGLRRTFVPVPRLVTGVGAAIMEPLGAWLNRRPRFTYDLHYFAHRTQFYDSSKAARELGYAARTFKEIVQDYISFLEAQRHDYLSTI